MTGPTISRTTADVTNKDSTNRWREFVTGLVDGGEVSFNIVFNPDATTHTTLAADLVSQTAQAWKILTDSDDTLTFSGYVTGFSLSAPLDGEQSADLTIKVTGAVTFS
jgi:predicted secreted protein